MNANINAKMNAKLNRKRKNMQNGPPAQGGDGAANQSIEETDEEAMVVAETYADYWPAKLKFGKKHPDAVVETASLSSVAPTDIKYQLALPKATIDEGKLSALQLESIIYASQAHEQLLSDGSRAGFLIGDGAGVGKGRTVAGIIYESYQHNRKKAIWISVSPDLLEDSKRDLADIGAKKIAVYNLSKFKYAKIDSKQNNNVKEGVIFSTYSSLIGKQSTNKNNSRLNQLVQWFGPDYDGVIIFDECHKAKHLVNVSGKDSSQTGKAVEELQNRLPNARVVYASATGASEPRNMAYMNRLGLWGEGTHFRDFAHFLSTVEKRGVGAMEVVAMDMKLRGMYIARQLSFKGVTFKIDEIPFDQESEATYNLSVELWVEAYNTIHEAMDLMKCEGIQVRTIMGQFWGAHQRFFKYLCIAAKIKHAVQVAKDAIADGKCVVIGLQSTGEARTLEELGIQGGKLNDFVSTAKAVFLTMIRRQFPAPKAPLMEEAPASSLKGKKTNVKKVEDLLSSDEEDWRPKRKRSSVDSSSARQSSRRKRARVSYIIHDSDSETDGSESESESDDSVYSVSSESNATEIVHRDSDKGQNDDDEKDLDDEFMLKTQNSDFNNNPDLDPQEKEDMENELKNKMNAKQALQMKMDLLDKIEKLGERLPTNTLDNLIDLLGGTSKVAELTGRKGRVVRKKKGVEYESRGDDEVALERVNLVEKDRFMKGEKLIAIISEAASNGISLQSDRRVKNKRRRVHITLELPWSADRAIQQFGRTHRANQECPPEYVFLITNLAGERRFAASVAKRLESLGALTHADRRATDTRDLSQFNVENAYGKSALRNVYTTVILNGRNDSLPPPVGYEGNFFDDLSNALYGVGVLDTIEGTVNMRTIKDADRTDIAKFLNRILGLPVKLQNHLFKYFTDTMEKMIEDAKKAGKYDMGIVDMGDINKVKILDTQVFLRKHATGVAPIELHTVEVDRGLTFDKAAEKCFESENENEGFYLTQMGTRTIASLAMVAKNTKSQYSSDIQMQIYRPNIGLTSGVESLSTLIGKSTKVTKHRAEDYWNDQYKKCEKLCTHQYYRGKCNNTLAGFYCDVGLRKRKYYLLAGSIFAVWHRIEAQIKKQSYSVQKLQVVRMKTIEGRKIVGVIVPSLCVSSIIKDLSADSVSPDEISNSTKTTPSLKDDDNQSISLDDTESISLDNDLSLDFL